MSEHGARQRDRGPASAAAPPLRRQAGRLWVRTGVVAGLVIAVLSVSACRGASNLRGRAPARMPGAQDFYDQAQRFRAEGRSDKALMMLSRAIEQNPEMTIAHVELGELYFDRGEFAQAERRLATAARQGRERPTDPSVRFRAEYKHGLVLHIMGRLGEAVRAYVRAINIEPDDFDANMNLGTAYLQLDGPSQARRYAEKAVGLNPASGEAHANLGAVYSGLAAIERADGREDQSITLHEQAVREYESAAELMMLRPLLLVNWADSLGKLGRYQEMVNTLETVLRIEPDSALAWERLGFAYFRLRDYESSMESFRASLERDSGHYPSHNGLGVCLLNQWLVGQRTDEQRRALGISHLRASLRLNPSQGRIVELVRRYAR